MRLLPDLVIGLLPTIAIYVELSMSNEIQISSSILLFIAIYYAYLSLFDAYIRWQQLLAVLWP